MASRGKHSAQHSAPRGSRRRAPREPGYAPRHAAAHGPSPHADRAGHVERPARREHVSGGAHYRREAPSRNRKRRRIAALAVAACAVVAVLAGGAIVHGTQAPEPQTVAEQPAQQAPQPTSTAQTQDPQSEYARIVTLVNQADRTVVPLSKVISKTVTSKVAKRIDGVLAGQQSAASLLDEAGTRLATVTPELPEGDAHDDAAVLADSIAARKDMLTYGCTVLRASSGAHRAGDKVVSLWQNYLKGHEYLQSASDAVTAGTTAAVKKSLDYDERALSRFKKATELVEDVQKIAPDADLSVERKYATLQVKAAQEAVSCDRALLKEDAKAAKKHNAAYGKQAANAAKVAKTLPATTDDLVKSIYYSFGTDGVSVQEAQNRYEKAAKRAAKDDRKLAGSSSAQGSTSKEN